MEVSWINHPAIGVTSMTMDTSKDHINHHESSIIHWLSIHQLLSMLHHPFEHGSSGKNHPFWLTSISGNPSLIIFGTSYILDWDFPLSKTSQLLGVAPWEGETSIAIIATCSGPGGVGSCRNWIRRCVRARRGFVGQGSSGFQLVMGVAPVIIHF